MGETAVLKKGSSDSLFAVEGPNEFDEHGGVHTTYESQQTNHILVLSAQLSCDKSGRLGNCNVERRWLGVGSIEQVERENAEAVLRGLKRVLTAIKIYESQKGI